MDYAIALYEDSTNCNKNVIYMALDEAFTIINENYTKHPDKLIPLAVKYHVKCNDSERKVVNTFVIGLISQTGYNSTMTSDKRLILYEKSFKYMFNYFGS
jgi:hypothetical protein